MPNVIARNAVVPFVDEVKTVSSGDVLAGAVNQVIPAATAHVLAVMEGRESTVSAVAVPFE